MVHLRSVMARSFTPSDGLPTTAAHNDGGVRAVHITVLAFDRGRHSLIYHFHFIVRSTGGIAAAEDLSAVS